MSVHDINITLKVTDEDIDDIMYTALDGITYWAYKAEVVDGTYLGDMTSDQISRGGEIDIYECDEDKPKRLTLEKFLNGIKLWYTEGYDRYGAVQHDRTLDCGQIDNEMADIIIQYALFGDIQYG